MASDSPRNRIDKFFASKKRKPVSPGLKSGRTEKDAKHKIEISPSSKGTLDNYLRTSQDGEDAARPTSISSRRNLSLDIDNSSNKDSGRPFPAQVHSQSSESFEKFQNELSQDESEMANIAVGDPPGDHSLSVQGMKSTELKQFATSFLSLYCSEVQSQVNSPTEPKLNDRKRHGSLMLDGEDKPSKKRPFVPSQMQMEVETECSNKKNLDVIQSSLAVGSGENGLNLSREITLGSNPVEFQASLRKCSRESRSVQHTSEFSTPGSSTVKARAHDTPQSTRGSSKFSPGEAFWNEAIQIADGLFAQTNDLSPQGAKEFNNQVGQYNRESAIRKVMEMLVEGEGSVTHVGAGRPLESTGKHKKETDNEVSPLPVKHLDFLFEEKKLDSSIPNVPLQDAELPERGSVSHSGPSTTKTVIHHHELETTKDVQQIQEQTSIHGGTKRKGHASRQYNDSTKMTTPVDKIQNANSVGYIASNETGTPSSSIILKDRLSLKSWLPPEICSIYEKKGISELYPWQVDCLQVDGVLQRRNLVYCASTSAGKSFVAEILMLRRVISTGKMALLVLPYVSICAEKAEHLEVLLEPLGKHVRSYYGSQGGGTLPKDTSVAVCTIEKANSLINRLLEEGRLSEIGIIVIDELHMVGDRNRGYLLELLLTKLRYAAGEGNSESSSEESSGTSSGKADPARALQIVGMSATMPNVEAVADWLQAALYQTEFRPVPLEEYIKIGNTIYNKNMEIVRTIARAADLGGKDPDHVVELCNEVVQEGHSVLIFCSSRKGCESTARHVSKFLKKFSVVPADNSEFVDIASAIDTLRRCPAGLDPILEETLPSGVAYHHAGLTVEEREIIETCYRRGLVRVLTATSTLAAGVNLPARRVIFRQPRIGRDFLDGTRYKQMAGRAGRTGIDTKGESVLICKPEEVKRIMAILNRSCPPLESCLSEDKNGMIHAILEVVAGGIVQTANDINRYVRCTLLNSTKPFEDVVKSAQDSLRWLCHKKFLEWSDDTKLYGTTPLGRASFGSSLCPEESLIVLDDLSRAREGFVLASDLHLVYLVTPTNVEVEPNWELYYERFMELPPLDQSVALRVGVAEPFLMRMAHGAPIRTSYRSRDSQKGLRGKFENQIGISKNNMLSDEQILRVCKRFFVALILSRLVQEAPVGEVCEAFKVARGMVQALQENAGRFASMVSVFCERLGWHDLEGLVAKFQNRVSFGVRAEIVELTTIPYVKGSRARALYKAGLRTPLAIAEASIPEIAKALFESSTWAAQESSAQRRLQLGVAKKIKNGARKIVLDKAEEARAAAFSAFKSLGLSVPQFSKPLLVTSSNLSGQETVNNVGDDSPGWSTEIGRTVHVSSMPMIEGKTELVQVSSKIEGKECSVSNLVASTQQKPAGLQNPQVPTESLVTDRELVDGSVPRSKSVVSSTHTATEVRAGHLDLGVQDQANQNLCLGNKSKSFGKGPINAASIQGGFDSFLELWKSIPEFYFDIHYNSRSEVNSSAPFEIHGIAVCWENSPVYYVNLPKDLFCSNNRRNDFLSDSKLASSSNCNDLSAAHCLELIKDRWGKIGEIMRKTGVRKVTWNLKVQIQVLKSPVVSIQRFGYLNPGGKDAGSEPVENSYLPLSSLLVRDGIDMCVVAWILWPDEGRSAKSNLEKECKRRLSNEAVAAANLCGRWKNQMRRAAHNGCCRRAAQTRALCSALWKLLISEELVEVLLNIEAPLVNVLAEMELWGIGVDMEGCLWARNLVGKKLRCLEKEAYKHAGVTFSLHTPADIANVLYGHLKLPIPEGLNKGKQHPSTDKHSLDLLRDEHPIIPVIKEHRTLVKLMSTTLGSMCSRSRLSSHTQKYTLHGHWLHTSTATGRLSMEDPNLQCVEHMVEIKLTNKNGGDTSSDCHKINARDFFVPTQDNWLLLTADYSQIELRLMAHFSKDPALIELLSKPQGDVFTMMAAIWTGKQEDTIDSRERDQTKRLVYGILYGMGADTLAEQLSCSRDEAKEKIKNFKSSFPGVASWLQEAVSTCHQKGYVQTLKGRKRFLSKIKSGNSKEKSKAQRQAVNSICQGSAADIIKIAMIKIYSVIVGEDNELDSSSLIATNFHMLKDRCRILLQVHDELVLEADPSVVKEAALLLQLSMEHADSLLVPLRVKLKVGRTWGSLGPYSADEDIDAVLSKLGSPGSKESTVENTD